MKEKGKAKIGYEDFFDVFDGYYVLACHSNRTDLHLNIEDLYQAFKQRLMAELMVSAPDLRTMGLFIDSTENKEEGL